LILEKPFESPSGITLDITPSFIPAYPVGFRPGRNNRCFCFSKNKNHDYSCPNAGQERVVLLAKNSISQE